jgi:Flp pilus assembly protein TadB
MRKIILLFMFILMFGCSSTQYKSDYDYTADQLDRQAEKETDPVKKELNKRAAMQLRAADKTQEQNSKLQEQVISKSEKAGAGVLVKWLIGLAFFIVAAFIVTKIKGIF